jgi:hypothetical protein
LLRAAGDDEQAEGAKELEQAKALIQETGAVLFEPFINANLPDDSDRSASIGAIWTTQVRS